MIDVSGLELSLDAGLEENHVLAMKEIARQLGISAGSIESAQIIKRSVDARKRSNVHFVVTYRLTLTTQLEEELLARAEGRDQRLKGLHIAPAKPYVALKIPHLETPAVSPVVVGMGPAGLFAAWYLAKCGLDPVLIEQGAPVEERTRDVETFFKTGKLDPYSNIQFGEGGAGTFSDGKLTTNAKNRYSAHVLQWFVDAGAPESILWQAHPHLGSDNLVSIVAAIRDDIIRLGGAVHFHTQLVGFEFEQGSLSSIELRKVGSAANGKDESFIVPCQKLILACGHSAREVFELTRDADLVMEQKPFSMGVRIEHPQQMINEAQWGSAAAHPALGSAEYKFAIHLPSGRHVYTFCMCPGGEVVAAASEEGGIVTNGMSEFARSGENANAALLVNVDPSDLPSDDILAGVELQREVERRAYEVAREHGGEPYQAPAQTLGSFMGACETGDQDRTRSSVSPSSDLSISRSHEVRATYERGVVDAPIDQVLPAFVTRALRDAFPLMGKKIKGFDDPSTVITAPETRSSSPVRICRDESLQAFFSNDSAILAASTGIYPCGEGPGFAGGIMSAAADGLKVAEKLAQNYRDQQANASYDQPTSGHQVEDESLNLDQAIEELLEGRPVAFPTDTVFGLGVAVNAASSPQQLYDLKSRSSDKPIAWLIADIGDLDRYGKNISDQAYGLARKEWPGPLTLIVEASDEVPRAYRSKEDTIALRVPDHDVALALLSAVGPIATTSANLSGQDAPTRADDIDDQIKESVHVVPGEVTVRKASSVVDCTREQATLIREGAIDPMRLLS